MPKPLNLIVACSRNRVIGRAGGLPWSIPEDTTFFEGQTRGHSVVIGRRSLADWPGATDQRDVVVITRDASLAHSGVQVAASLDQALDQASDLRGDVYICGGQRVYEEALPRADRLYLTLIDADIEGDTFFPDWTHRFTHVVKQRSSQYGPWHYTFLELIPSPPPRQT